MNHDKYREYKETQQHVYSLLESRQYMNYLSDAGHLTLVIRELTIHVALIVLKDILKTRDIRIYLPISIEINIAQPQTIRERIVIGLLHERGKIGIPSLQDVEGTLTRDIVQLDSSETFANPTDKSL